MIIEFSSLGSGDDQVDLCGECKYSVKVLSHNHVAQWRFYNGTDIKSLYGDKDVKLVVVGIKRCHAHAARNPEKPAKPAFLEAALNSGIDINDRVDEYRYSILRSRFPEPII